MIAIDDDLTAAGDLESGQMFKAISHSTFPMQPRRSRICPDVIVGTSVLLRCDAGREPAVARPADHLAIVHH